jgi:hypothetical protein
MEAEASVGVAAIKTKSKHAVEILSKGVDCQADVIALAEY